MNNQEYIFLDLETTGGIAHSHRIIEVGLIHIRNGEIVDKWSTLVNPGRPIPHNITMFTGISDDMVQDAPSFADIHETLLEKLQGKVFTAHSAKFDYGFLKNEFRRLDIQFCAPVLCTVRLSRRLYPDFRRHGLDALIERFELQVDDRHRAMGDVMLMWQFWQQIQKDHEEAHITEHINELLKRPNLPVHLNNEVIENMPDRPGVYLFYGKKGDLLYIGKSKNLRERVLSYFCGDRKGSRELKMTKKIDRIEYREKAGIFGAQLEEVQLVKGLEPLYNRHMRKHAGLRSFQLLNNNQLKLMSEEKVQPQFFSSLYGLYHNSEDAKRSVRKIAEDEQLCLQTLGIEKGSGPCNDFAEHKCRGACHGKESHREHTLRVKDALRKLRLQAWPYRGPIGIREQEFFSDDTDIHVFDQWCYLGTAKDEAELQDLLSPDKERIFDIDMYRVLKRHLSKTKKPVMNMN